ncbi:MAG: DUF2130 domain-containing protein [Bacteroidota bacterium]
MVNQASVECPSCGAAIDVDDVLRAKVDKELRAKYESDYRVKEEKLRSFQDKMVAERDQFSKEKEQYERRLKEELEQHLGQARKQLTEKLKKQLTEEKAEQIHTLQEELNQKSEQLRELNQTKAEVEKLKREKLEIRTQIELESERKLNTLLEQERKKIAALESEKNEFKLIESKKIIDQLKEQLQEANRKAEQGSMQLQGEAQELAIEEWLRSKFPMDTIEEIKKGVHGADCVQVVNTRTHANCGLIYYESKRTQNWSKDWIDKFKKDIQNRKADIGVLVTSTMPKELDRMGLIDGVWVCTYSEFKGLCAVLRQQIVNLHQAIQTQENKGDKMSILYDYLTSPSFKNHIEGIVGAFQTMQEDLLREQRSMKKHWKQREKQIELIIDNTIGMYGSIKGIAGGAIAPVKALELDAGLDEEDPDLV